jgi:hypothetical protein
MEKKTINKSSALRIPLLHTGQERLAVWESTKEMLKGRAPAMLKELRKIRKEWDRKLPNLA